MQPKKLAILEILLKNWVLRLRKSRIQQFCLFLNLLDKSVKSSASKRRQYYNFCEKFDARLSGNPKHSWEIEQKGFRLREEKAY